MIPKVQLRRRPCIKRSSRNASQKSTTPERDNRYTKAGKDMINVKMILPRRSFQGIKNLLVRVSNFEENLPKSLPARDFVEQTAAAKLEAVVDEMTAKKELFHVVIASDTVIYFEGEIIGKPADAQDAFNTLQRLRGREHFVYTGVALAYNDGTKEVFSEETRVEFGQYPDRIIKQYVDSGEPLTRAGSYGIQEYGAVFVKAVHGCFSNVVGLPIYRVHSALVAKGIL